MSGGRGAGQALAAGGDNTEEDTLISVEAFDPQQNRWEAFGANANCAPLLQCCCNLSAL